MVEFVIFIGGHAAARWSVYRCRRAMRSATSSVVVVVDFGLNGSAAGSNRH